MNKIIEMPINGYNGHYEPCEVVEHIDYAIGYSVNLVTKDGKFACVTQYEHGMEIDFAGEDEAMAWESYQNELERMDGLYVRKTDD